MAVRAQYQLELRFECRGLPSHDLLSKSDPCVLVFMKKAPLLIGEKTKWEKCGHTEVIRNQRNPVFAGVVGVPYLFEQEQKLRLCVYDIDHPDKQPDKKQDFCGKVKLTVGQLVRAPGMCVSMDLVNNKHNSRKDNGSIIIRGEIQSGSNQMIKLDFKARKLEKMDGMFGKADPYFKIVRANADGTNAAIYESPVRQKTLDPDWPSFELPLNLVCAGELQRALIIELWDWDANSKHDLIGRVQTSVQELMRHEELEIINPEKEAKKKGYKNSGILICTEATIYVEPSFVDFLQGGAEIALCFGIDYTASNGSPSDTSSLHSTRTPTNPYKQAIKGVGEVVAPYDADRMFPVYGFGAQFKPSQNVKNPFFFPVRNDYSTPLCHDVSGVLEAYSESLKTISLSGPTNFAPLIDGIRKEYVEKDEAERKSGRHIRYTILLLLTDGEISDMPQTRSAIAACAKLPLSIIIVGVGSANFASMKELDGDDKSYSSRDLVQFVPYDKFKDKSPESLAKETLHEVPGQFVKWAKHAGVPVPQPRPPTVAFSSFAPPPQGYPPQYQGGYPPQQAGWGGPAAAAYPPPQAGGWDNRGAPPGDWNAQQPPAQNWQQQPPPQNWNGAPQQPQGWGAPPPAQNWQQPPPQGWSGAPPQQPAGWGAPAPGWGVPPADPSQPPAGWGVPPAQ